MDILFEIVSRQKFSADFSISHLFGRTGGVIGRAADCDWVLPDRGKLVSRRHARISFHDGAFHLEDISSNGIRLAMGREKMDRGAPRRIEDGDGFIIGEYTIMAKLLSAPEAYAQPLMADGGDILDPPEEGDPLAAMDNEAARTARDRLGCFSGILDARGPDPLVPSGHGDLRFTPLPTMRAEYDPWNAGAALADASTALSPSLSHASGRDGSEAERAGEGGAEGVPPEITVFFQALGYARPPASRMERERILRLAGELTATELKRVRLGLQLNTLLPQPEAYSTEDNR